MKTQDAKKIPITDILDKMGHSPKKQKGTDFWYLSPLRKEDTPSFKVDINQNLWYDHGSKQGGSVIDLVMNIKNYTVSEALNELAEIVGGKVPKYEIKHSQEAKNDVLGDNITQSIKQLETQALIEYLQSRKINVDIAKHYLQEVYYQVDGKNYFALCFKNDSGGYELRSKYYKGSLKGSVKDITSIIQEENDTKTLIIFEGFIDFLSFFTVNNFKSYQDLKEDVIVLNSLSMLEKTIEFIKNAQFYGAVKLYLDNDEAGKQAVNKIMFYLENVKIFDMSGTYKDFKDLNESLMLI
jgi:DNA primase